MTTRGHVFLGSGVCIGLAGMVLGLHDLTKVGGLLLVLPLLAILLVRRDLDIEVSRTLAPARVAVGEHADVTLTLHNRRRRSTPLLRGEEGLAFALGDRPRLLIPRLEGGGNRQLIYRVRSQVRGRHPVGPLTLRMVDPFGLATRSVTVPGDHALLVLPRIVPLTGTRGGPAGAGAEIASAPRLSLHGEDDVGVREYRVGDDLRRVHWRSTARTGETMVRQDEHPARRRALVLLDDRASVHAGAGSGGSFEWSVTTAASIATLLLRERFEVHLHLASQGPDRGRPAEDLDRLLDLLAAVQPAPATSARGIVDAIDDFTHHGGGLVVGILGALEPEITGACTTRARRGLALVLDRDSFLGGSSQHGSTGQGAEQESTEQGPAQESSRRLDLGGWRTRVVRSGDDPAALWARLTTGPGVRS